MINNLSNYLPNFQPYKYKQNKIRKCRNKKYNKFNNIQIK